MVKWLVGCVGAVVRDRMGWGWVGWCASESVILCFGAVCCWVGRYVGGWVVGYVVV